MSVFCGKFWWLLRVSAEICVNHVQFCRPKLENLCEEDLKPAVVVSTGENSTFFMRWDASLKENVPVLLAFYIESLMYVLT